MASENNPFYLTYQEPEDKEKIKKLVFLLIGKHISNEEADSIVNKYKTYLNKDYVSLNVFVWALYCDKRT